MKTKLALFTFLLASLVATSVFAVPMQILGVAQRVGGKDLIMNFDNGALYWSPDGIYFYRLQTTRTGSKTTLIEDYRVVGSEIEYTIKGSGQQRAIEIGSEYYSGFKMLYNFLPEDKLSTIRLNYQLKKYTFSGYHSEDPHTPVDIMGPNPKHKTLSKASDFGNIFSVFRGVESSDIILDLGGESLYWSNDGKIFYEVKTTKDGLGQPYITDPRVAVGEIPFTISYYRGDNGIGLGGGNRTLMLGDPALGLSLQYKEASQPDVAMIRQNYFLRNLNVIDYDPANPHTPLDLIIQAQDDTFEKVTSTDNDAAKVAANAGTLTVKDQLKNMSREDRAKYLREMRAGIRAKLLEDAASEAKP